MIDLGMAAAFVLVLAVLGANVWAEYRWLRLKDNLIPLPGDARVANQFHSD